MPNQGLLRVKRRNTCCEQMLSDLLPRADNGARLHCFGGRLTRDHDRERAMSTLARRLEQVANIVRDGTLPGELAESF